MRSILLVTASFLWLCLRGNGLVASENLDRMRELYHQGRYDEAIELVPVVLKEATRSDSAEVLFCEASAERIAELAEIKFMEISRRFAGSPYAERALLKAAVYQYEIDNPARSEFLLRKILKDYLLTPLEPEIRLWLGKNYLKRGEYRSAQVELKHGINSLPDFPQTPPWVEGELHYWLGETCSRAQDYGCAREAYLYVTLLEEKGPLSVVSMAKLTSVLESMGAVDEAGRWRREFRESAKGTALEKMTVSRSQRRPSESPVERVEDTATPPPVELLWVQVGSFSSHANAESLAETIREKGIETEIKRMKMGGRNYFRVRVGPFEGRDEAIQMLRRLREAGIDGRVLHD